MRRAIAIFLMAAAVFAGGCSRDVSPGGGSVDSTVDKVITFPAKGIRTVSVAEINGTVRILFERTDDVVVKAGIRTVVLDRGVAKSFSDGFRADAVVSGGELSLRGVYPKSIPPGYAGWIGFSVVAPEGTLVRVDTINGGVWIGSGAGAARVRTEMGGVTVEGVRGALEIQGRGGDVSVSDCAGPVKISTGNGNVSVSNERLAGDYLIRTLGGDVSFETARSVGGDIEISTMHGEITNSFELAGVRRGKGTLSGKLRGGGPRVVIDSVNGLISVGDAQPAPPGGKSAPVVGKH